MVPDRYLRAPARYYGVFKACSISRATGFHIAIIYLVIIHLSLIHLSTIHLSTIHLSLIHLLTIHLVIIHFMSFCMAKMKHPQYICKDYHQNRLSAPIFHG